MKFKDIKIGEKFKIDNRIYIKIRPYYRKNNIIMDSVILLDDIQMPFTSLQCSFHNYATDREKTEVEEI